MKAYAPLLLAALALASCDSYDHPTGHARVARQYTPAPTPVAAPVQAVAYRTPAAAPTTVSSRSIVAAPNGRNQAAAQPIAAAPAPVVTNQGATVTRSVAPQQPAAQQSARAQDLRNQYPLMPGQNRGLKSRGW